MSSICMRKLVTEELMSACVKVPDKRLFQLSNLEQLDHPVTSLLRSPELKARTLMRYSVMTQLYVLTLLILFASIF